MGFGAGRGEYHRLLAECSDPWSFGLGGLSSSFFLRPKPSISVYYPEPRDCLPNELVSVQDKLVNVYGSKAVELYINVENSGRTSIKRMRARVKIHPMSSIAERELKRPNDISDEDWKKMKDTFQESEEQVQKQAKKAMFGRFLPFFRTPKGAIPFHWIQADGNMTYEIDLTPKSDEAMVRLVEIYRLDSIAQSEKEKVTGYNKDNKRSRFPVILQIGYLQHFFPNYFITQDNKKNDMIYDLAVKFWIVAENLTKESSKIFHIEIPESLDRIDCSEVPKHTRKYKKFDKLLEV